MKKSRLGISLIVIVILSSSILIPAIEAGILYLKYHDGIRENSLANSIGYGQAVEFTPPKRVKILEIGAYFLVKSGTSNVPYRIHIYDDDYTTELISPIDDITNGGWDWVDISSHSLYVEHDFLIAFEWLEGLNPYLAIDFSNPDGRSWSVNFHTTPPGWWHGGFDDAGDWMITVKVDDLIQDPDLIVEDIWWSPSSPEAGQPFDLSFMIRNQGAGDAVDTFRTQLFIDGSPYFYADKNGLDSGVSYYWQIQDVVLDAGDHPIRVYVDSNDDIDETNEGNNERTETCSVSGSAQNQITIEPNGGRVYVDDTPVTSRQTYEWDSGSVHNLDPDSGYQPSSGTKLIFNQWSDGNTDDPRSITVTGDATYTTQWDTQYYVTFQQSGCGGTPHVTVDGGPHTLPYSTWMDSGSPYNFVYESPVTEGENRWVLTSTSHSSPLTVTEPTAVTGYYSLEGGIELYYDDGVAEGGWGTSTLPHYKAVRFHAPTTGAYKLRSVKYYITSDPLSFELQIRDVSASMIYSETVTPTETGWFTVDLSSQNIYVQGDFYVALKYLSVQHPKLGGDTSDPDLESGEGQEFPAPPNLVSLDWMIRAVLGEWPSIFLSSSTDDGLTDIGTIIFKGITEPDEVYELPTTIAKAPAWYIVWASLDGSGYEDSYNFLQWETSGGVWVDQPNSPQTSLEITGDGQLTAVWELKQLHISLLTPNDATYRRGDIVSFQIEITDQNDDPGEKCFVTAVLEYGQPIPLSSLGTGIYSGYYRLADDAPIGRQSVGISASLSRTTESATDHFWIDDSDYLITSKSFYGTVEYNEKRVFKFYIPPYDTTLPTQLSVVLTSTYSDTLYLTLYSPSGTPHPVLPYEDKLKKITVSPVASGEWTVEVFGYDVPDGGYFYGGFIYEFQNAAIFDKSWLPEMAKFVAKQTVSSVLELVITNTLAAAGITGNVVTGLVMGSVTISMVLVDYYLNGYFDESRHVYFVSETTDGYTNIGTIIVNGLVYDLSEQGGHGASKGTRPVDVEARYLTGYQFDYWEVVLGNVIIEKIYSSKTSMTLQDSVNVVSAIFKPAESSLQANAHSPVNIMVTDPQGLRIGFDPETMSVLNEIPSATYSGPGTDPQIISIPNPSNGSYLVEVFGTGAGSFTMNMQSVANGSIVDSETWEGIVVPDQQCIQTINLSTDGEITSLYDVWTESFTGTHPIVDFAVYNGTLYAASDNNLYVYDGNNWITIQAPAFALSLMSYEGKLYMGVKGSLYSFNGTDFTLILTTSGYVGVLGIYNNKLYAGTMLDASPTLYYCNGSADNPDNWYIDTAFSTILNFSGSFGSIDSFAVFSNAIYVTSGGAVYSYNGTDWSIVTTYVDVSAFLDMKVYNGKLYLATRDQAWRKPYYLGYSGFSGRVIEFDGNNWITVFDYDYWIYSLETYNDKLYIGTANKIYTYNATYWETSFNSEEGVCYAISFITFNNTIYAGVGNGYIFEDPSPEIMKSETVAVPEFSSFIFLPLLMLATLGLVLIKRRKRVP